MYIYTTAHADGGVATGRLRHRYAAVQRVLGLLTMLFSLTMLPPMLVSYGYGDGVLHAFALALAITLVAGTAAWWPVRRNRAELKIRDGFLITVLCWAVLSAFAAIPLYLGPVGWPTYTDAMFEAVSGLTTTGATVVQGLDTLPASLNYYRAQLQWLGGMGVIVLAVALLPMLGVGGMQLFRAETPGPMKESKLTPRIASTARALWTVYVALTLVCMITYWLLGMTPFDAVCHGMTTVATGGFSTHDASIGYFNSLAIEIAAMVFMVIAATNFALHFLAWRQRSIWVYLRDTEFRGFLTIVLVLSALVAIPLWLSSTYPEFGNALRKGVFQVIAYGTNTGYTTADPTAWPGYLPLLVVLGGFFMGCSGSTVGGVKALRLILFIKQALRELQRLLHPSAQLMIKLGGRVVPDHVVYSVGGFFSVYVGLTIVLTLAMIGLGMDAVTAFSAVAAAINNTGPGLGDVYASMAGLGDFAKWVMLVTMLMGRLEIFTFLIIFTPAFWRR